MCFSSSNWRGLVDIINIGVNVCDVAGLQDSDWKLVENQLRAFVILANAHIENLENCAKTPGGISSAALRLSCLTMMAMLTRYMPAISARI
jgi:hypothetical protein